MNKKLLGDLMRQAQAFQEKMQKLQEEIGKKTVEASAGGGMVVVRASGRQEILSITIDPEVINSKDVEMIQDLVMAAVNAVLNKARELAAEEMKGLTGGFPIPGLF